MTATTGTQAFVEAEGPVTVEAAPGIQVRGGGIQAAIGELLGTVTPMEVQP